MSFFLNKLKAQRERERDNLWMHIQVYCEKTKDECVHLPGMVPRLSIPRRSGSSVGNSLFAISDPKLWLTKTTDEGNSTGIGVITCEKLMPRSMIKAVVP